MNVSISRDLEQYVQEKVKSGRYPSASEVIDEGLRLLKKRDEAEHKKHEELRAEIAIGIEQADRGQVSTFNEETLKEIEAEGRNEVATDRRRKQ